eukprot:3940648-Rhodomonas_salina.2
MGVRDVAYSDSLHALCQYWGDVLPISGRYPDSMAAHAISVLHTAYSDSLHTLFQYELHGVGA